MKHNLFNTPIYIVSGTGTMSSSCAPSGRIISLPKGIHKEVKPKSLFNRNDLCPCGSGIKIKNCCGL